MATVVLGIAGRVIGAAVAGPIGAVVGGALGAVAGSVVDQQIFSRGQDARARGPRLKSTDVMASTEGAAIPRLYGRSRIAGQVIWSTRLEEKIVEKSQEADGGGKGGGGSSSEATSTSYVYFANFAVGLCEGRVRRIGRIWFDGKEVDQTKITVRRHLGGEGQTADSLIAAKEGASSAPAYRGTAYLVFERLKLTKYGNRIPQVTAEVFRSVGDLEAMVSGVALIPGSTEFGYEPQKVKQVTGSKGKGRKPENRHTLLADSNWEASLDMLEDLAPSCNAVSLVVAWFGDDLRCGSCDIRPKVELSSKQTTPMSWQVAGLGRAGAQVISQVDGKPAYGGAPNDASVIRAIQDLKDRGFDVMVYPFVMMDIPADNTKANPYSDNAATSGQPAYPWRGRITCSPAPGYAGTVDQTSDAGAQLDAFMGSAEASDFGGSGTTVSYSGPDEWRYNRFILHVAKLCDLAGGVDAFCIGSEMVGLTRVRNASGGFGFVNRLRDLAGEVRSIVGNGTKIGYAADWSEYHSYRPADGSGDVLFHLDPLWADDEIDFIGIDNYLPLADWRDGTEHLDYDPAGPAIPHDLDYLWGNVEGGEYFDWFYDSDADRAAQIRTSITDGAGKPWVFRQKDIRSWWSSAHYDRPGGVEAGSPTSWVPMSKPIWFTEVGCPAVDKGANQPNVFVDPKSSESFYPYFSSGARDDAIQRAYLQAMIGYWAETGNNPASTEYSGRMIDTTRVFVWCWDARPPPSFPGDEGTWADARNWRLGHWLTARLGAAPARETIETVLDDAGFGSNRLVGDIPGVVDGVTADRVLTPRVVLEGLASAHGVDAVESGGNVVFTARAGRGALMTIDADDLVIAEQDGTAPGWLVTRSQESEIPTAVRIGYGDPAIDDQAAAAEARRHADGSRRVLEVGLPMTMTAATAATIADRMLYEAWIGRERLEMILPPARLALDPGDVVRFAPLGEEYRITALTDALARSISGERSDAGLYIAAAPAEERLPMPPPPAEEAMASVVFIDGPLLGDDDPDWRGYVAADQRPWSDGVALYRSPTTSGYVLDQVLGTPATLGETTADFYAGPAWRWDRVNSLYVAIDRGELASVSEDAVLNGANALALENADGDWEILQFATATLNGTGNYILSDLLRGQRGSEHAMRSPVAAGARIVLLTSAVAQPLIAQGDVGLPLSWRYGSADIDVEDDSYQTETVTLTGRGRRPYAPVQLRGRRDPDTGDWTLSWIRRTRLGGDSWDVIEVPIAEDVESYRLEILDGPGGAVLRSVDLSVPSYLYTVAMQTADFGSPVWNVPMRVNQLSPIYGAGVPAELVTYHH